MKHQGRAFWEQHVCGLSQSGQTRRAYCAEHGLNRNTLDSWRRRLAEEQAPTFVALRVKDAPQAPLPTLRWPSGVTLTIPPGCDAQWLSQVLSGLR